MWSFFIKECLFEEVTFEKRLEESEGTSHVISWVKCSGRKNNYYKSLRHV